MIKNHIKFSNYFIFFLLLLVIIPYHINKKIFDLNQKTINLYQQYKYLYKSKFNYKNDYNYKDPPPKEDDDKNYTYSKEMEEKINELNTKIQKSNIYIIFLTILAFILFLLLVIYGSIKCYILCTNKNIQDYRVSEIGMNKLGDVYLDGNGDNQLSKTIDNNSNDYDAPIYANNKKSNAQNNTFNPDKYIASNEDKNLYKPFKNEEIQ